MTAEECIKEMVRLIAREHDPLRILLFGSRARGTAKPQSDIDLIVVFAEVANAMERAISIRRTLRDMEFAKDVIVTTPKEIQRCEPLCGHVLHYAIPESRVLYERAA